MKVAIVDDSLEVQRALGTLLAAVPGVVLVGCAEDVAGARALIDARQPDVVVLDVALRGRDRGFDVLRYVRHAHPQVRVMALSNFSWQAMRDGFLQAGASAYFDKSLQFGEARDWIAAQARQA